MKLLVIGAGVSGLTTAYALSAAGHEVTIYTKDDTFATTSAVAGAFWEPYLVQPRDKAGKWSQYTCTYITENLLQLEDSGLSFIPVYSYQDPGTPDPWWRSIAPNFRRLDSDEQGSHVSGWSYDSPVFDTPVYLRWLINELAKHNIEIIQKTVESFATIPSYFEAIINCSGLGARELCDDKKVYPVRGQLLKLAKSNFDRIVLDATDKNVIYVVPHSHEIIIGGTSQANDWNLQPYVADTTRILEKLQRILPEFKNNKVLEEKVGLRPARDEVRLEAEMVAGRPVIHNYGHGGAGYTLSWGCAADVVKLVENS